MPSLPSRLRKLGYATASEAAAALGLDRSGMARMWNGQRPVTGRTWELVELLEAEQPVPMDRLERRLLGACEAEAGALAPIPDARSNFELGIDWRPIYKSLDKKGLITAGADGAPVLTELGARAVAFLRKRGLT